MAGPALKGAAVAHLQTMMDLSERRACSIVGTDRKMVCYQSCRPPETSLRSRLRELANECRCFDNRLLILLLWEGELFEVNRIYRLCREAGLTVRKRRAPRRTERTLVAALRA